MKKLGEVLRTSKVARISLTVVLIASIALGIMSFPSAEAKQDKFVSLDYARIELKDSIVDPESGEYGYGYRFEGVVQVANIDPKKKVEVFYDDGTVNTDKWKIAQASYLTTYGGKEYWKFVVDYFEKGNTPYKYTKQIDFAIKYEVKGREYWDNNDGQDYTVASGYFATRSSLILREAPIKLVRSSLYRESDKYPDSVIFSGNVVLKNFGPVKKVKVKYTEDDWKTYKYIDLTYANKVPSTDMENWYFAMAIGEVTSKKIQYCFVYDVNGVTYYDNNYGKNYTMELVD